jgi:16S rRNA (guanine1207-N2)-methyltransferase
MTDEAWKTLFHPFETGELAPPGPAARILFIGVEPGFRLPEDFSGELTLVQGFRPAFLELTRQGFHVLPEPEGEGYDLALVLAGRHRGRNEAWIAEATHRLRPGGLLVVASTKRDGADGLRRRMAKLVPLDGHLSKHHGIVFWFSRPETPLPGPDDAETLVKGRFHTAPGMFSHGRVDPGSRLLVGHLPDRISGKVADFGAGWGYLSAAIAERAGGLAALHLYEADFASCTAARLNLAGLAEDIAIEVFWRDAIREAPEKIYDFVVMNPPFHGTGRAADPAVGAAMIAAAAGALRKGGTLLMVANAGLPYEPVIGQLFTRQRELERTGGFKVISAVR